MKWIKCSDRLPLENENVILYDGSEVFCGNYYKGKNDKVCFGVQACDGICYGNYSKGEISHWMPLPNIPKNIYRLAANQNIDPDYVDMVKGLDYENLGPL